MHEQRGFEPDFQIAVQPESNHVSHTDCLFPPVDECVTDM